MRGAKCAQTPNDSTSGKVSNSLPRSTQGGLNSRVFGMPPAPVCMPPSQQQQNKLPFALEPPEMPAEHSRFRRVHHGGVRYSAFSLDFKTGLYPRANQQEWAVFILNLAATAVVSESRRPIRRASTARSRSMHGLAGDRRLNHVLGSAPAALRQSN